MLGLVFVRQPSASKVFGSDVAIALPLWLHSCTWGYRADRTLRFDPSLPEPSPKVTDYTRVRTWQRVCGNSCIPGRAIACNDVLLFGEGFTNCISLSYMQSGFVLPYIATPCGHQAIRFKFPFGPSRHSPPAPAAFSRDLLHRYSGRLYYGHCNEIERCEQCENAKKILTMCKKRECTLLYKFRAMIQHRTTK